MTWILVGVLAGSIVVSQHTTREACEGRAVMLREQKVVTKCVELQLYSLGNTFTIAPSLSCPNGVCQ